MDQAKVLIGVVCVLTWSGVSWADVVTVPASRDVMIFGQPQGGDFVDTGSASGKGPAFFAGADGSSNKKRSLIHFDVASAGIPAGATITNVTMTLYLGQVAGSGGGSPGGSFPSRTFRLFDILQDWGEGNSGSPTSSGIGGTGQGFPRQTGDSTWDYAFFNAGGLTAGKWNNGTSDTPGGNFSSTESAVATFNAPFTVGTAYNFSSAGMAADVQSWLDGSAPNFGWLIKSDLETSATSFLGFWSKEGAVANTAAGSEPPALTITFVVPEPGSVALLLLGGAALLRRARYGSRQ